MITNMCAREYAMSRDCMLNISTANMQCLMMAFYFFCNCLLCPELEQLLCSVAGFPCIPDSPGPSVWSNPPDGLSLLELLPRPAARFPSWGSLPISLGDPPSPVLSSGSGIPPSPSRDRRFLSNKEHGRYISKGCARLRKMLSLLKHWVDD